MQEMVKRETVRRVNPVDADPYKVRDVRDESRGQGGGEESARPSWPTGWLVVRKQLETHMVDASATSDKPRWRKIVEHANSLADEMGVPREDFYAAALVEYIEKRENERIGRELNEAYGKINQDEELARLNDLVSHYDPRLADE